MSKLNPCSKAIDLTDKIMKLFVEEKITFSEAADVPAELERRLNQNIRRLKEETIIRPFH